LIDEYVENATHLVNPSYSYVIKDIKSVQGTRVVLEDSIVLQSAVIARLLEQCEKVAVFLVTIDGQLEETVSQLAEDGLIRQATVLDAIGSSAVENIADFVQSRIRTAAWLQGLGISQRFSPGYCDWNVRQQEMVFRAMNGDLAGIHLTKGCLMIPRKSISGIIGIGPGHSNIENYNPCPTCKKRKCPGRRQSLRR